MEPSTQESFSEKSIFILLVTLTAILGVCLTNPILSAKELTEDQQGDLKDCHSLDHGCSSCSIRPPAEEMDDKLPFIDILGASVAKTEGTDPSIIMRLKVADKIPPAPRMLTSYSFALDLDGDPATGFNADKAPLGVFPDLGVDVWVNLSLNRGTDHRFVFIGPNNIKKLNSATGLLDYAFGPKRRIVTFTIPVKPIERKLTFAYLHKTADFKVELEKIKWVAFTSKLTSYHSADNPICDFHPDKYFEENPEGCLLRTPASFTS